MKQMSRIDGIGEYSHVRHTISELGETGSPVEKVVGYGLFLGVGVALLAVSAYIYFAMPDETARQFSWLIACVAAGYVVAAIFPCDAGSPVNGSIKQHIHNSGGFIEYAGGAFFMLHIARELENDILKNMAYTVFICALLISINFLFPWRGLIQRIAEAILFGSMIWIAMQLKL
jgi:hypothetical protein